jgi:hypothetical protein
VVGPPGYTTTSGVISSWSTLAVAGDTSLVELKVARVGAPGTYTITGSSQLRQVSPGGLNTFLTRIPVQDGDVIGLYYPPQITNPGCSYYTGDPGDVVSFPGGSNHPDPSVGTVIVANFMQVPYRVNVSARLEPDADGDGYGDLTQDACPSLKNSHDDCTPPDTFLKAGPPKRLVTTHTSAKVKITFFASEPAATFTCQLGSVAAKPCNGKVKVRAKPGKHAVTITAVDAVGNIDPTPLVVRFTVVPKPA